MLKSELRSIYKQKRIALKPNEIEKLNDLILIQFQKLNLPFFKNLLSNFPFEKMNEPDTFLITRFLQFQNPELTIAYPKIINENNFEAIIDNDECKIVINKYGIEEIEQGKILAASQIDVILVPLLINDKNGYRVGYGKGFYDNFLKNCNKNIYKIGLSFYEPISSITDINQFDVPLTHCITPDSIYEF